MWWDQAYRLTVDDQAIMSVGGQAHPDGFNLRVLCRSGNYYEAEYRVPDWPKTEAVDWPIACFLIATSVAAAYAQVWWLVVIMVGTLTKSYSLRRRYKSWHWCEHQLTRLLEDNISPTEGLLRSQTGVSIRCGSVVHSLVILAVASDVFFVMTVISGEIFHIIISLLLYVLWQSLICRWHILAMPLYLSAMLIERVCYLRKPTTQQLAYTLAWGKDAEVKIARTLLKDASEHANAQS